jgi:hypothetical protein
MRHQAGNPPVAVKKWVNPEEVAMRRRQQKILKEIAALDTESM